MPDLVQVGNETNGEILSTLEKAKDPIDWTRNARLLNAGIRGVRDAAAQSVIKPRVMLHIAQPENVEPWFAAAVAAGVTDFDLIGISYYRRWSTQDLDGLAAVINRLRHRYDADVVVVEAAYPWTLASTDSMPNVLGQDTLIPGYPATPDGQRRYLIDLTQRVIASGGFGVVYWEPAWISTSCKTRWGTGSGWENAALFDFKGALLPGADYLDFPYSRPVDVEFVVDAQVPQNAGPLYLWGDFLGAGMSAIPLDMSNGRGRFATRLMPATVIRYQLYRDAERREPLLQADRGDTDNLVRAVVGTQATRIDLSGPLRRANRAAVCASKRTMQQVTSMLAGSFNETTQRPGPPVNRLTGRKSPCRTPRVLNRASSTTNGRAARPIASGSMLKPPGAASAYGCVSRVR